MSENNAMTEIFNSYTEADTSIKELQKAEFDINKLSIVGRHFYTEEYVVGIATSVTA
jgi:hypothetical protein